MRAKLYCKTGLLAGAKYEFSQGASIGRSGVNSIVLEPPLISDEHARIFFDAKQGAYFLEDMGSRNGTFLDGIRVARREKLGALHVITLARKFDFIFQIVAAKPPAPATPQPAQAEELRTPRQGQQAPPAQSHKSVPPVEAKFVRDPAEEKRILSRPVWNASPIRGKKDGNENEAVSENVAAKVKPRPVVRKPTNGKTLIEELLKQAPRAPKMTEEQENGATMVEALGHAPRRTALGSPKPVLHLEAGANGAKQIFALKEGENFIGRSPLCEICIDDPSISRKHAVLHMEAGKVWVKDLGSRNHTYAGGATVAVELEVTKDTMLRFGTVEAKLVEIG